MGDLIGIAGGVIGRGGPGEKGLGFGLVGLDAGLCQHLQTPLDFALTLENGHNPSVTRGAGAAEYY